MDFSFAPEQLLLRDNARGFGERFIQPGARERDRTGAWDSTLWRHLGEAGLLGLPYPEELGGGGLSCVETCLVSEGLSHGACDGGLLLSWGASMILCGVPIWKLGTERQQRHYLPPMASGEWVGAFCLSEPGSGSDAASMRTRAVHHQDRWVLNGTKMWITNGPVAHHFIMLAVTEPERKSLGISAFIVDAQSPGLRVGKPIDKMGMRASPTSEVILEDCEVPEEALLGEPNFGFVTVGRLILGWERTCLVSPCLGAMERELARCVDYARSRTQFGRPIGSFQAVRHKLADMKVMLEVSRNLIYRAAWALDRGEDAMLEASTAKVFVSEAQQRMLREAIQIHGGNGFTTEYQIERSFRDAMLATIGGGTSEIQRSIIARQVLGG